VSGAGAATRPPARPGRPAPGRGGVPVGAVPRLGGARPAIRHPWRRRRGRVGSTSAAPDATTGTPTTRTCPAAWRPAGRRPRTSSHVSRLNRVYEPHKVQLCRRAPQHRRPGAQGLTGALAGGRPPAHKGQPGGNPARPPAWLRPPAPVKPGSRYRHRPARDVPTACRVKPVRSRHWHLLVAQTQVCTGAGDLQGSLGLGLAYIRRARRM
jgi:hypothetical protein